MPKVAIKEMHGVIGKLSRPVSNIPTGVWELRAIKLSAKDITKTTRETGEEYDTVEYLLSAEPLKPTASVNPDEVNEIDEETGKPVYEGKRLFLRFTKSFRNEMAQLDMALQAFGIPEGTSLGDVIENNKVRGKTAKGEIFNRTYKRNDGSDGVEQKVRSWAGADAAAGFAL